jgi:hypothetical protein
VGNDRETLKYVAAAISSGHEWLRGAHEETEVGSLLLPSRGPTQVGTTPGLSFRALLRGREVMELQVAL